MIPGHRQPWSSPQLGHVSDLLHPHQRAPLAEIARVTELPAARHDGVPQPDGLTVVPAEHRFEARGLLIGLCCLPTYEQKPLFALELFPLEYLHGSFENLSPPDMRVVCAVLMLPVVRPRTGPVETRRRNTVNRRPP
jgi:hypothetical protein